MVSIRASEHTQRAAAYVRRILMRCAQCIGYKIQVLWRYENLAELWWPKFDLFEPLLWASGKWHYFVWAATLVWTCTTPTDSAPSPHPRAGPTTSAHAHQPASIDCAARRQ